MVSMKNKTPYEDCLTCFFPPIGDQCTTMSKAEALSKNEIKFQVDGYITTFGKTKNFPTPQVVRKPTAEKYSKNSVINICLWSESDDKSVFDYYPVIDSRIYMIQADIENPAKIKLDIIKGQIPKDQSPENRCDYEISATFPDENVEGMEAPKFTGQLDYILFYELGNYSAEVADVVYEGFPERIRNICIIMSLYSYKTLFSTSARV